jgi:phosphatidylserine/phosphatidylglycerophosphate/cardiolipin synthase-like enzyme
LMGYLWTYTRKLATPYLHAKMILIDHKILLLGSMNLSANSLDKNREIWILLTDPTLIQGFTAQFTKDWNSGK